MDMLLHRVFENRVERRVIGKSHLSVSLPLLLVVLASSFFPPYRIDLAQEDTPTPSPTLPSPNYSESESSYSDEVLALRTQVDVMRSYDQRLLETVYWSLGTLATLAVLIAGFSWFTNFRLSERDRQSLRSELQAATQKGLADLQQQSREVVSSLQEGLSKSIDNRIAFHIADLEAALSALRHSAVNARIDIDKIEAKTWEQSGVLTNALASYTEALSTAIGIGSAGHYVHLLGSILSVLEQLDAVSHYYASRLVPVLDKLASEHSPAVNRIKRLLDEKLKP